MLHFSFPEVERRFLSQNKNGSISFNKKCLVTFSNSGKCYEYAYKTPIDLIRKLNLATDAELLELEGKKRCDCGSKEIVSLNDTECFRCRIDDDFELFG